MHIICSYSDPANIADITVQAISFWLQQQQTEANNGTSMRAVAIIQAILECLSEDKIAQSIAQSNAVINKSLGIDSNMPITDYLFVILTGFIAGALHEPSANASNEQTILAMLAVRTTALQAAAACAPYISLFAHLVGKKAFIRSTKKDDSVELLDVLIPLLVQAVSSEGGLSMANLTKGCQAIESIRAIGAYATQVLATRITVDHRHQLSDLHGIKQGQRFAIFFMRLLNVIVLQLFDKVGSSPTNHRDRDITNPQTEALYASLPVLCSLLVTAADNSALTTEAAAYLDGILTHLHKQQLFTQENHLKIPSVFTASVAEWLDCHAFVRATATSPAAPVRTSASGSSMVTEQMDSESEEGLREAQMQADKLYLGARVLCMLLQAPQPQLAQLVGKCLQAFFPMNPALVLVHTCLSPLSKHVTIQCRAAALAGLAACINSESALPLSFAMILQFLAVTALCDPSAAVRTAGISLLGRLKASKSVHAGCPPDATLALSSVGGQNQETPFQCNVVPLCTTLLAVSSSIEADADAAMAVVSARVMAEADASDLCTSSQMLLYVAALATKCGGQRGMELATIIFHAAKAAPLQQTWRFIEFTAKQLSSISFSETEDHKPMTKSELLVETMLQSVDSVATASINLQKEVGAWAHSILSHALDTTNALVNVVGMSIRYALITRIAKGWAAFANMSNGTHSALSRKLFDALLAEQQARPGQDIIIRAMKALPLSLTSVQPMLSAATSAFNIAYDNSGIADSTVTESHAEDIEEIESSFNESNLALPMQQLACVLEALQPSLLIYSSGKGSANADVQGSPLDSSDLLSLGTMLNNLLQTLTKVCNTRLNTILSVEYTKCLIMELCTTCINAAQPEQRISLLSAADSKVTTTAGKKSTSLAASSTGVSGYPVARLHSDVDAILKSIINTHSVQMHMIALNLLKALLTLDMNGQVASQCVASLGQLLANTTATNPTISREGGISNSGNAILTEVLGALVFLSSKASGVASHPQFILQPLLKSISQIHSQRRGNLLVTAIKVLGPTALPPAISILLLHALVAHETDSETLEVQSSSMSTATTMASVLTTGQDNGFVLLSKAASKKNDRMVRASIPEDLFHIAIDTTITQQADVQVKTLVAMAAAAQTYFSLLSNDVSVTKCPPDAAINTELLQAYHSEIIQNTPQKQNIATATTSKKRIGRSSSIDNTVSSIGSESDASCNRGMAAAMVLLSLEYLFDIIENRTFHRQLVSMLDAASEQENAHFANSSDSSRVRSHKVTQVLFLSLFDQLLQLITAAATLQSSNANEAEQVLDIQMGKQKLPISMAAFARTVDTWCLDILRSLHKLLDAASVVSILQELLDHEHANVRKTALHILSQRLERLASLGTGAGAEEELLLLDLSLQLRSNAADILGYTTDKEPLGILLVAPEEAASRAELAQSSLMCIDALARVLGADRAWSPSLMQSLHLCVHTANALMKGMQENAAMQSSTKGKNARTVSQPANSNNSLITLLASLFLCSGTIVKAGSIGAKALPFLATLVNTILTAVEVQVIGAAANTVAGAVQGVDSIIGSGLQRARTLLLRSAIASLTNIISAVPSFYHPHISKTLSVCLGLDIPLVGGNFQRMSSTQNSLLLQLSPGDLNALSAEIDQCMSTIASAVPTRLAIPALTTAVPQLLQGGHMTALRTARFMGQTWTNLDREAILQHMSEIYEVSLCLLDYRRSCLSKRLVETSEIHWDSKNMNDMDSIVVEECICEAIVSLCLKLTETELRTFLARFAEWRDRADDATLAMDQHTASGTNISQSNKNKRVKDTEVNKSKGKKSAEEDDQHENGSQLSILSIGQFARRTAFYRLLDALGAKLQSLFTPCMVPFWQHAANTLSTTEIKRQKLSLLRSRTNDSDDESSESDDGDTTGTSSKAKKAMQAARNKKRKAAALKKPTTSSVDTIPNNIYVEITELLYAGSAVLDALRTACTHDTTSTVTEERYMQIMPNVTTMLVSTLPYFNIIYKSQGQQQAMKAYSEYMNNHVIPCVSALALCVGRDILWKPLVHKVLMSTREKSSAIRLAALQTLHRLFVDLGEELLILLPECLPYLSELMEDDASDVVDATSATIRYVEELSGEKLDEYLK